MKIVTACSMWSFMVEESVNSLSTGALLMTLSNPQKHIFLSEIITKVITKQQQLTLTGFLLSARLLSKGFIYFNLVNSHRRQGNYHYYLHLMGKKTEA